MKRRLPTGSVRVRAKGTRKEDIMVGHVATAETEIDASPDQV